MNAIDVFQEWLDDYLNFERNPKKDIFWLDTIDFLCKRFDNPQDFAPCIHVAGSKGKGSVSKMIACILEEAGYSVGLYSSPHIVDFRERICKPSGFFDEEIYEKAIKEMVPNIDSIIDLPGDRPITWFELVTLYAFLCFRQAKVDWSVYEVGLGGRLDTTNVIRPKICCITPIELEHTEFLGDTLEKIAAEKAGIIKNCTPVVIAPQVKDSVKIVFREKAITRHAPYYFVDDVIKSAGYCFNSKNKKMKVHFESDIFNRPIETELSLLGKMQAQNAAQAAITVRKILPNLSEDIIEKGLSKASLPGRFEIIEKVKNYEAIPQLILDGAHTCNSIKLTLDTLHKLYQTKKFNLLFACAADKDIKDISLLLKDNFVHMYITKPGDKKHSNINAEIEAFEKTDCPFTANSDYKLMIKMALEESEKKGLSLLVTGSFYLIAEVKNYLMSL